MVASPYEWKILEWDEKINNKKTLLILSLIANHNDLFYKQPAV